MTQYAKGDTVYLPDGTECEYVIATSGGYLVNVILLTGHDGEMIIDPQIVSQIFPEPPRAKRAKQIEALDAEIAARETTISRLQREQRDIETRSKHFESLIKRNEALQFVEAFLENRITHLVSIEEHGTIKLEEFQTAIKVEGKYESGMKLLSLFGKSGGDLQWRLHKYSTEERTPIDVYSFFSFEAARAFVQTKIDELTAAAIVDKHINRIRNIRASAIAINMAYTAKLGLPDYVLNYLEEQEKQSLVYRKEKLLEELEKVNKELGEE